MAQRRADMARLAGHAAVVFGLLILGRAQPRPLEPVLGRFCKTALSLTVAAYKATYQIPGSSLFVRLAYA
jgi:hypothetical protein